ncbi:agmatine deiminase family protein, partial [Kitasatospora purpeofusca]|uniref:agmatine deiminase family protein n=1 Tax=Kitasatospora purpeofusca TaxID=67352 RepID=UPI002A5ACA61
MSHASPARRTVLRSLAGAGLIALGASGCAAVDDLIDPAEPSSPATDRPAGGGPQGGPQGGPGGTSGQGRRLGAEWEKHERTVMSWPASEDVWGEHLAAVRKDIAEVARAVGEREPVVLLVRPGQESSARNACGSDVELLTVPVDDLWARDTVPV